MKIKIDDEVIFEITDFDLKCMQYYTNKENLFSNIKDGVKWQAQSACESPRENMKKEWLPVLFKRYKTIPTDDQSLLNLIFSQPDYKDRYQKDCEEKAARDAVFKNQ